MSIPVPSFVAVVGLTCVSHFFLASNISLPVLDELIAKKRSDLACLDCSQRIHYLKRSSSVTHYCCDLATFCGYLVSRACD